MTVEIKLDKKTRRLVKQVTLEKLRALRAIHGSENIVLVFDLDSENLNWRI